MIGEDSVVPDATQHDDARAIASSFLAQRRLSDVFGDLDLEYENLGTCDVVAIGKAAPEMSAALRDAGVTISRQLVITDAAGAAGSSRKAAFGELVVGEHPVPSVQSLAAGRALRRFLAQPSGSTTIFLISGGTSSLCVDLIEPVELDDLANIWRAALARGLDITELNTLRAACSHIAAGGVLDQVQTERSLALVMVDNVVSGAPWVASGLTYDHEVTEDVVRELLERLGVDAALGDRLQRARASRDEQRRGRLTRTHRNLVLAEPAMMLEHAVHAARALGYDVRSLGARVVGDVRATAGAMVDQLTMGARDRPVCVVAVGEVMVQVRGAGRGGRCQSLVWECANELARRAINADVVALSSDGCDHELGVGGAYCDGSTMKRALAKGYEFADVVARSDVYAPLAALGQLIDARRTGWNLCDIYVACSVDTTSGT